MVGKQAPLPERLWRRVDVRGPDDCWDWQGARSKFGHGRIGIGPASLGHAFTHRVAYEQTCGPIPPGMFVCHHCDNPPCCNPALLFLGTPADNSADMAAKGRCKAGGNHPMAVLCEADVLQIWSLIGALPERYIADRFGVTQTLISLIRRRKLWARLTADLPTPPRTQPRGRCSPAIDYQKAAP